MITSSMIATRRMTQNSCGLRAFGRRFTRSVWSRRNLAHPAFLVDKIVDAHMIFAGIHFQIELQAIVDEIIRRLMMQNAESARTSPSNRRVQRQSHSGLLRVLLDRAGLEVCTPASLHTLRSQATAPNNNKGRYDCLQATQC